MTGKPGIRRLQLRLAPRLYEAAQSCAGRSGVSLGAFVRMLIEDALAASPRSVPEALVGRGDIETRISTIAGLVASENALLALERFLPKDRLDGDGLRSEAIRRAEQRLAEVRSHVEREQM